MKCPVCENENRPGIINCINCGSDLYTVLLELVSTTELQGRNRLAKMHQTMPSSRPLVLYIRNSPEPIAIPRSGQVVFGRKNGTAESQAVDIDLGEFNGEDLGVSRVHARLDASVNPPTITDLDSFNGTFINGQQLNPHSTYGLQSSDEIRLGRVVMRLFYDV